MNLPSERSLKINTIPLTPPSSLRVKSTKVPPQNVSLPKQAKFFFFHLWNMKTDEKYLFAAVSKQLRDQWVEAIEDRLQKLVEEEHVKLAAEIGKANTDASSAKPPTLQVGECWDILNLASKIDKIGVTFRDVGREYQKAYLVMNRKTETPLTPSLLRLAYDECCLELFQLQSTKTRSCSISSSAISGGEEKKNDHNDFLDELNGLKAHQTMNDILDHQQNQNQNQSALEQDIDIDLYEKNTGSSKIRVRVEIVDHRMCRVGGEGHVRYKLKINRLNDDTFWYVDRRFSEFYDLSCYLNSRDRRIRLIPFPNRFVASVSGPDVEVRDRRLRMLENFLNKCLGLMGCKGSFEWCLRAFLEVDGGSGVKVSVDAYRVFERNREKLVEGEDSMINGKIYFKIVINVGVEGGMEGEVVERERRYSEFESFFLKHEKLLHRSMINFPPRNLEVLTSQRTNLRGRRYHLDRWLCEFNALPMGGASAELKRSYYEFLGLEYVEPVAVVEGEEEIEPICNISPISSTVEGENEVDESQTSTLASSAMDSSSNSNSNIDSSTPTTANTTTTAKEKKKKLRFSSSMQKRTTLSSTMEESQAFLTEKCKLIGEDDYEQSKFDCINELRSMVYYPKPGDDHDVVPVVLTCILTFFNSAALSRKREKEKEKDSSILIEGCKFIYEHAKRHRGNKYDNKAIMEELLGLGGVQILAFAVKTHFNRVEFLRDVIQLLYWIKCYDEKHHETLLFEQMLPRYVNNYFKDAKVLFETSDLEIRVWLDKLYKESG